MWKTKFKTGAMVLVMVVTCGGLLAQQAPTPKPRSPVAAASIELAQTEAKLAKFRDLIKPQPGEFATNIARIAWERDPWEAAVKAAREGKPVIAYGLANAGVTCGFG